MYATQKKKKKKKNLWNVFEFVVVIATLTCKQGSKKREGEEEGVHLRAGKGVVLWLRNGFALFSASFLLFWNFQCCWRLLGLVRFDSLNVFSFFLFL